MQFSDLELIVISLSGHIKNFTFDSNVKWEYEEPFLRIITDTYDSISPKYYEIMEAKELKKNKRGRKKKEKKKKKFKSNISFVYFEGQKEYTVRIYNHGDIVCVGILKKDLSDFYKIYNYIKQFLIKKGALESDLELTKLTSVLENYKFTVNRKLNLLKIEEYFIQNRINLVNIDLVKLYKFFAQKIHEPNPEFCPETIIESLNENTIAKAVFQKTKFLEFLQNVDLIKMRNILNFKKLFEPIESTITRPREFALILTYHFVEYYLGPKLELLQDLDKNYVESIRYNDNKNTLIIKKNIGGQNLTTRIFTTGSIDIQGSKNYENALSVYNDFVNLFKQTEFTYDINNPPNKKYEDFI